jgi:hypothetical protein
MRCYTSSRGASRMTTTEDELLQLIGGWRIIFRQ